MERTIEVEEMDNLFEGKTIEEQARKVYEISREFAKVLEAQDDFPMRDQLLYLLLQNHYKLCRRIVLQDNRIDDLKNQIETQEEELKKIRDEIKYVYDVKQSKTN